MKEKIKMNPDELKKATRDLYIGKAREKGLSSDVEALQKQIEGRIVIKQQEDKLSTSLFNIEALKVEVEILKDQIESEVALESQRSTLMTTKSQLEIASSNIKVLEKQVSSGFFIEHKTMKPLEREIIKKEEN